MFKPYFLAVNNDGIAIKPDDILHLPDGYNTLIYVYNMEIEKKYISMVKAI